MWGMMKDDINRINEEIKECRKTISKLLQEIDKQKMDYESYIDKMKENKKDNNGSISMDYIIIFVFICLCFVFMLLR